MSTDAEVPLLEVRAGSVGRSLLLMVLHGCALAAIMLGSWLGRFTALERIAAYLPPFVRSIFILDYWVWAAGVVVLLVGLVGLMCYYEPRMGRARFFADRLELEKYVMVLNPLGDRHTVRWETVVAFDDSFSSHVRLAMSPRRWFERYRFTIPTPSEGERLRVLAALEARGLPRVG